MTMKVTLFISLIITFIFSCSTKTTTTGSINWWCTQTPHHQTCIHHIINKFTNISTATKSINQFLDITVKAAMHEAHSVLEQAHEIKVNYPNVSGKSLWGSYVDYFDGIIFTLNMVLDHMTYQVPNPLDVRTWLSACLTYINVCQKGFEMINMTNTMLPVISTSLTQLLLNSLAISVAMTPHSSSRLHEWNFSEEYELSDLQGRTPDVVVARDGSGNFTTVQEAVNWVGDRRRRWSNYKRYVIYVKSGVYEEHVVIPQEAAHIMMYGDGIDKTVITGDRHSGGDMLGTSKAGDLKDSATFRKFMHSIDI